MAKPKKAKPAGAHIVFHRLLELPKTLKFPEGKSIQAILLYKRGLTAPIHAGLWSLIGGIIKEDETPKSAVLREIGEELDICDKSKIPQEDDIEEFSQVPIVRREGKRWIAYYSYLLELDMDNLRLLREKKNDKIVEGEGLAWFTAEEIYHLPIRPEDRVAINEFFKQNGV